MKRVILLLIVLATALPTYATPPCGLYTWFVLPDRPAKEWFSQAEMVFTGKITSVEDGTYPEPNCSLADQSRCFMMGNIAIIVEVLKWEKGALKDKNNLKLQRAFCAQDLPKIIGGLYRFYTNEYDSKNAVNAASYIFYEPLDGVVQ